MVTKYGYRFCFLVTSIVYVFSTAPMFLLIRLVPPKKGRPACLIATATAEARRVRGAHT